MDWLKSIFSGSGVIDSVSKVIGQFKLPHEQEQQFKLEMERLVQERDNKIQEALTTELQSKERVLIAELNQEDKFTKRARPTVVYFGLVIIAINHVIGPWAAYLFGKAIPAIDLPTDFWFAWGGIVATWTIGRSFEKRGATNKTVDTIVGNKNSIFTK